MMKLRKHPSFLHSDEVKQVCSGFFQRAGLNAFSYSIVYKDLSRTELWTDAEALEYSFFTKKYIPRIYTPELMKNKNYLLYNIGP